MNLVTCSITFPVLCWTHNVGSMRAGAGSFWPMNFNNLMFARWASHVVKNATNPLCKPLNASSYPPEPALKARHIVDEFVGHKDFGTRIKCSSKTSWFLVIPVLWTWEHKMECDSKASRPAGRNSKLDSSNIKLWTKQRKPSLWDLSFHSWNPFSCPEIVAPAITNLLPPACVCPAPSTWEAVWR